MVLRLVFACLALTTAAFVAPAAPPAEDRDAVGKVNRAIDLGVQYLKRNHRPRENWEGYLAYKMAGMDGGVTALAALALLNCGEKADSAEVKAALDYLRRTDRQRTYVVALSTMALAEARQARDLPVIQENVNWLVRTALRGGGRITGWSYPFDNAPADGSNTQYALLGLYAGKQAGATIPASDWQALYDLYLKGQVPAADGTGFWKYAPGQQIPPSFTMTTAGVSGLVIAGLGLDRSDQKLDPATGVAADCGRYADAAALDRGINFIAKNFTFSRPRGGESTFYNVYGIERAGRLTGRRFLGKIDWYRDGCEYLVKEQRKDGGWSQSGAEEYSSVSVVATSFSLLFLAKGRTPVLVSKLAYGDGQVTGDGVFVERGPDPSVVGWNRKHNDARNVADFCSRELFKGLPMGWQVYDPRRRDLGTRDDVTAELGTLVQSPILYLTGHDRPRLTGQQKELVKRYVEEGGFVVAEACCGSAEFTAGYRALVKELFPDNDLKPVPPEHPLWTTFYAVPPTEFGKLECLDRGCRTVMVFSPEPLAGYWEEAKYMAPAAVKQTNRGGQAFRLAGNIVAYATGLEPPAQKLTRRPITDPGKADLSPPRGFLKPAQLRLRDEPAPAPAAMRNLMGHVRDATRIDVVAAAETLSPDDPELTKYRFLYLHGRKRFTWDEAELTGLRATLQSGGVLLADSACGKPEFDEAFRANVKTLFPAAKLEPVPLDDELYSAATNGTAVTTVKRREAVSTAGAESGFKDLPPALEGVKLDGRWAVIYSKYDLGCSLEGHKSTDCLGHDRASALRLGTAAVLYLLKR